MQTNKHLSFLPFVLAALTAVILLLVRFLVCRSLWLDEAALANNLMLNHTILNNTTYLQGAAPVFKLISLLNCKVFGINEYSLRLFPMVCSILSVPLFYLAINKIIKSYTMRVFAMFIYCINPALLYWGTEFKQYSCDCFISLLLINLVLYTDFRSLSMKKFFLFSFLYSCVIWLSHFSLFFFVPLLVYFIVSLRKTDKSYLKKLFIFCASFLFSFSLLYFLHLNSLSDNSQMHTYWEQSFLTISNFKNLFNDFLSSAFPLAYTYFVFIFIFLGIILYIRKDTNFALFLVLIFFSPILASLLSLYPFNIRLNLSLIAVILILCFKALDECHGYFAKVCYFAAVILFIPYFAAGVFNIFNANSYYREEMRPLLLYIKDNKKADDKIYLTRGAHQAFRFYNTYYKKTENPFNFREEDVFYEQYCPAQKKLCNVPDGFLWVIFSANADSSKYFELMDKAKIIEKKDFYDNSVYYIMVK